MKKFMLSLSLLMCLPIFLCAQIHFEIEKDATIHGNLHVDGSIKFTNLDSFLSLAFLVVDSNGNIGFSILSDPQGFWLKQGNLLTFTTCDVQVGRLVTIPGGDTTSVFIGNGSGILDDGTFNRNIFIGNGAGRMNTTGSRNVFVGRNAGHSNTTRSENTFIGHSAGFTDSTGSENTFVGSRAGYLNKTGSNNTFLGSQSGTNNQDGYNNSFFGQEAGEDNLNGHDNVFLGRYAGNNNKSGDYNVIIGSSAGLYTDSASQNVIIGREAGYFTATGQRNAFIGYRAGRANTSGSDNVFIGNSAGTDNVSGKDNVFIGDAAGLMSDSSSSNTFVGQEAGRGNTSGNSNVFLGEDAGYTNSTGSNNTFVGEGAGRHSGTGGSNTFIGSDAGRGTDDGIHNTFIGRYAGLENEVDSFNVALGYSAGSSLENTRSTFLGCEAESSGAAGVRNSTAVGYQAVVDSDNQIRIGNSDVLSIGGYAGWSNLSDGRFKKDIKSNAAGLDFILKLNPISYEVDRQALALYNGSKSTSNNVQEQRQTGFIAQEIEALVKELGIDFNGVDFPDKEDGLYALRYAEFVVPLVKATQEQQAEIELLKRQNSELMRRLDAIEGSITKN